MDPSTTPPTHEHISDVEHAKNQFKSVWERFGNIALTVLLLITAPLAIYRLVSYFRLQASENAWSDLATTTSPDAYRLVAQSHGDATVTALAYLRGGDAIMTRLLETENPASINDEQRRLLADAKEMYQQAIDTPEAAQAIQLGARLGLAGAFETLGEFGEAAKQYETIITAMATHPTLAATAKSRLALLPRLESPVVFAPESATDSAPESAVSAEAEPESSSASPAPSP